MSRQINLFNPELLPQRVVFPAGHAVATVVLGMILIFVLGFGVKDIAANSVLKVQQQSAQRQALKQQIAQLEAERNKRKPDAQLIAAVDRLKEQQDHQQRSLALLQMVQHEPGFAEKLKALSRQRLEGLWLTEITFAGEQSTLEGRTLSPELVPRWMDRLKDETSFHGNAYRVMEIAPLPAGKPTPPVDGETAPAGTGKHPSTGYRFKLSSKLDTKSSDTADVN